MLESFAHLVRLPSFSQRFGFPPSPEEIRGGGEHWVGWTGEITSFNVSGVTRETGRRRRVGGGVYVKKFPALRFIVIRGSGTITVLSTDHTNGLFTFQKYLYSRRCCRGGNTFTGTFLHLLRG